MPTPVTGRSESLSYICAMLSELQKLAKSERHDMLSFLIEMAYVEAGELMSADDDSAAMNAPPHRRP